MGALFNREVAEMLKSRSRLTTDPQANVAEVGL